MSTATSIAVFLLALLAVANGYSKYGRTCADIGCLSTEECKIMEDPCDGYGRDSCGRYPTCQKKTNVGGGRGETCASKFCSAGTSCRMEDGVPTCKSTVPGLAYDSAGISSVNGQRANSGPPPVPQDPTSRYASSNPYANANAPSLQDVLHGGSQPYPNNNNNNNGYPAYPGSNGNPPYPTNNNGYPPYPTNNNNNYPQNPYNNRPAVDQYGYPVYPPTQRPDNRNHNYPQPNLPQHSPGGYYGGSSIYRRNGADASTKASATLLATAAMILCARIFAA